MPETLALALKNTLSFSYMIIWKQMGYDSLGLNFAWISTLFIHLGGGGWGHSAPVSYTGLWIVHWSNILWKFWYTWYRNTVNLCMVWELHGRGHTLNILGHLGDYLYVYYCFEFLIFFLWWLFVWEGRRNNYWELCMIRYTHSSRFAGRFSGKICHKMGQSKIVL